MSSRMNERYMFRGKRKDNGKWEIGHYVITGEFPIGDESDLSPMVMHVITNGYTQEVVDPNTVDMCTGLRDINKKLIFEGDIVEDDYGRKMRVEYSLQLQQTRLYQVGSYENILGMSKGWPIFDWLFPSLELTVIGNIYDNAELLVETQ